MAMSYLRHEGVKERSGRYPWGSGENPYQRLNDFSGYVKAMKKAGMTEKEIWTFNKMTSTEYRDRITISSHEKRARQAVEVLNLREKGKSVAAIARELGISEGTVENRLNPAKREKDKVFNNTIEALKTAVDERKYIMVGSGAETQLGIARVKFMAAVRELERQGYSVGIIQVPRPFEKGLYTKVQYLAPPGTTQGEVWKNRGDISNINSYTEDKGHTYKMIEHPRSVDSNRVLVKFRENGGAEKDGTIELRPGVEDLDLGASRYSQVRIAVDNERFMKGIAKYGNPKDFPKGVDVIYYTNKKQENGKMDAMKKFITSENNVTDNPFKSTIKQKYYIDKNGKEQLSALNIVGSRTKDESGEEGSWGEWSRNLSSQVLSKQSTKLAKKQLGLYADGKQEEYDTIMSITNPAVKQKLLETFANDCDAASIHLKAAALPRQANQLIVAAPGMKDNEVFAPNFNHGEKVVLVRHPHAGIFEIPELTVNNRSIPGKRILPSDAKDAVAVSPKVAEQLSGADFDGDTVIVIPNNNKDMRVSKPLRQLKDFDPKINYPPYDGMKTVDGGIWNEKAREVVYPKDPESGKIKVNSQNMQREMGKISNLITDMTIKGADQAELARAVKHSMVVIDSEKHHLNIKQSFKDNDIAPLRKTYQTGGTSTLISRSKSELRVNQRKEGKYIGEVSKRTGKEKKSYIDPRTGEKLYTETTERYTNKQGKVVAPQQKITKMESVSDARELSSGTDMENIYADHANRMKGLGNQARKGLLNTKGGLKNKEAGVAYKKEVASLKAKLADAIANKPLEKVAQAHASVAIQMKKEANPYLTDGDLKKLKTIELENARERLGAKRHAIEITPKEWEAMQAGALTHNIQQQILNNVKDIDQVKQYAIPRDQQTGMTPAKIARAKALLASGNTIADVAQILGVSTSTISRATK